MPDPDKKDSTTREDPSQLDIDAIEVESLEVVPGGLQTNCNCDPT